MDLQKMIQHYIEQGLSQELAMARVCQDIVLKSIAEGPLNRNVTIKGGVVMRSLTNENRRATSQYDRKGFYEWSHTGASCTGMLYREIR